MIAYGICIGSQDKYERFALPGLQQYASAEAPIAESTDNDSILTAYNEILDAFSDKEDLTALVLLHEDLEIKDPQFEEKIREAFADPETVILGAIGATSVPGLEWWLGQGVGVCDETRGRVDFGSAAGSVEAVDGLLLVLSPWAVRNLRFDSERYSGFHAYDIDICFQARAAGKQVRVIDVDVHHHTKGGFGDEVGFRLADDAFRAKWSLPRADPQAEAVCPTCTEPLIAGPRRQQYEVALCRRCGIGVTLPAPARAVSGDGIWVEQYGGQRLKMRPQWFLEAQVRLSWLQLHVPDGRLLEVGGGTGEFCVTANSMGFEAYGAEPSAWAADQARQLGARVTTGDLDDWHAAHPDLKVDAVAAFHVFEHIHEPRDFLRAAHRVLAPGGRLILEVPNFDSLRARRSTFDWISSALTDHVYHYTARSLTELLAQEGFAVEHALDFSSRIYESPATWEANRAAWRSAGLPEAPKDMLRIVATCSPNADACLGSEAPMMVGVG